MACPMKRRSLLQLGGAAAVSCLLPSDPLRAQQGASSTPSGAVTAVGLSAQPTQLQIGPVSVGPTAVWAFNGQLPGPEIRVQQGTELRVAFANRLPEPSTIHWHGIRLPNAMDGVPGLTQPAVESGSDFQYAFRCPDAGTFWYHPHYNSSEQLGRGLVGALVVEEAQPIDVDQDLTWVLSDLRVDAAGQITNDFQSRHDAAHAGRIGNVVLINGSIESDFLFPSAQRIRLRLIAASNARIFGLRFRGARPWLVAIDGHPTPVSLLEEDLVLAPGQRADLILDIPGKGGLRIEDHFYGRQAYKLASLRVADTSAPAKPRGAPQALPANPVAPPVLGRSMRTLSMPIEGGARSPVARPDAIWRLHGQSVKEHTHQHGHGHHEPIFAMKRGETIRINLDNQTAWLHPMHFHGVVFQQIDEQTNALRGPLRDTLLLQPGEKTSIALRGDEPGLWMIHCHVLEHQNSGLMGVFEVKA